MLRSLRSALVGTFTLRFSTGLAGAPLVYRSAAFFEPTPEGGPVVVELPDGRFVAPGIDDDVVAPSTGLLEDGPGGPPPAAGPDAPARG